MCYMLVNKFTVSTCVFLILFVKTCFKKKQKEVICCLIQTHSKKISLLDRSMICEGWNE
jgi:hypothetical protein